ncbi:21402_t:CDS:2 [Rhizophagus irregularis]|nr:21402_t:CDS:2 [Rhizophagus irregularis]
MDVLGAFGVSALLREYLIIANFNIWTVREIERRINEKRAGSNKLGVVEIGLPSHHVELLEAVYNSFNAKRVSCKFKGMNVPSIIQNSFF